MLKKKKKIKEKKEDTTASLPAIGRPQISFMRWGLLLGNWSKYWQTLLRLADATSTVRIGSGHWSAENNYGETLPLISDAISALSWKRLLATRKKKKKNGLQS